MTASCSGQRRGGRRHEDPIAISHIDRGLQVTARLNEYRHCLSGIESEVVVVNEARARKTPTKTVW